MVKFKYSYQPIASDRVKLLDLQPIGSEMSSRSLLGTSNANSTPTELIDVTFNRSLDGFQIDDLRCLKGRQQLPVSLTKHNEVLMKTQN